MPIYEYRCATCGFEQEYLQKMSDAPLTDCPECGKAALVKMVSAAGFHLKGSGWYVTDFRDKGKKPAAGKDSAADKESKSSETESKPAETKDSPVETKKEQSVSGT